MGETLIKVEGVSKKFCRTLKRSLWYGMRDLCSEVRGRRHSSNVELRPDEFWAVKDVGFELKRGQCLGLIGRNGAGKTTLLRMLNGLIKPDQGRIEVRGRVGALIALGAGFNPILTGRENIYVNASVLGLSKREIDEKIDDIIDFAEIGEFIDMPVQSYSSGMQVRLGFGCATALSPDILLIDEVLAVGDFKFRAKCFNRIESIKSDTAIILVSHIVDDLVRVSQDAIVLNQGKSMYRGKVNDALNFYHSILLNEDSGFLKCVDGISIKNIIIKEKKICHGEDLNINMIIKSERDIHNGRIRINFMDTNNFVAAEWRSENLKYNIDLNKGLNSIKIKFEALKLRPGNYFLNIILSESNKFEYSVFSFKQEKITVSGEEKSFSFYIPKAFVMLSKGRE